MNDFVSNNIQELEHSINNSHVSEHDKKILLYILNGVLASQRGRLYVKDYQFEKEYIALRDQPGDNYTQLNICIIKKVIDEYSGATATRSYEFPSYPTLIRYYHEHHAAISLEISKANLNTGKSIATELNNNMTQKMIEQINSMTRFSPDKRSRAIDVLTAIEQNTKHRFYIIQQDDYEEYLSIRNSNLILVRNIKDPAGSSNNRNYHQLNLASLITYLDENKDKLGEEKKGFTK